VVTNLLYRRSRVKTAADGTFTASGEARKTLDLGTIDVGMIGDEQFFRAVGAPTGNMG
jgi:hypothetical protein